MMSQHVYVTGAEPRSGKSVITLALMEALVARGTRVGFFRPVVRSAENDDALIRLMAHRYGLTMDAADMTGVHYAEAKRLIGRGDYNELLKTILSRLKKVEKRFDRVLCTGTDFSGVPSALEFDFNADVANNLGCLVVPVVCAFQRNTDDIMEANTSFQTSLRERDCDILFTFINRVPARELDRLKQHFSTTWQTDDPVFVIEEAPALSQPTMRDVADTLGAELLFGNEQALSRSISHYQVAAMGLPDFLDRLQADSLVITPGDRADIIVGCLASTTAGTYPQMAGLLLNGGMTPAPAVQRLINGMGATPMAVLGVATETYTTAVNVEKVTAALAAQDDRKLAIALDTVEKHIDPELLTQRLAAERSHRVTPFMFEHELIQKARRNLMHIVLPEGEDERILRAAEILQLRQVARMTLLGEPQVIQQKIQTLGLQLNQADIINPLTSAKLADYAHTYYRLRKHKGVTLEMADDIMSDVSFFGTMMVYRGEADGMVSGAAHTTQHTIRPAFQFIKTKPGIKLVSSVFFMSLKDRVLVYGDCAVNPNPDAEELADIAVASADTAAMFDIDPVVAMLSYSSGESGQGAAVDKVREATTIARKKRPDLCIEGPIQYDAAIDGGVAKSKMPDSTVAGRATVFIFPDLNTGNNTYKAVQRSAEAVAVGPVLQGLNKPVNDLSRGCSVADIVNTVAITAIQAQAGEDNN